MNRQNILHFIAPMLLTVSLLLLVAQPAVAQKDKTKKDKNSKNKSKNSLPVELRDKADKAFFEGINAGLKNNFDGAEKAFADCLSIDAENDAAMYQLARIYLSANEKETAQNHIEKALKISPDNKWYLMLYAQILNDREDYTGAVSVYKQMISRNPRDIDAHFELVDAYLKTQKLQEAIGALDELEKIIGINEMISQQKEQLYIKMNMSEKAMAEVQKLINNNPAESQNYIRLAELYKANNMPEKALELYHQLLKVSPDDPAAKMAMVDYYHTTGDEKQYFEQLNQAISIPTIPANAKIAALQPYISQMAADSVLRKKVFSMAETIAQIHKNDAMAHIFYADLLNINGKPEKALSEFEEANRLDNNRFEVWQQILWLQYQLGKINEMQKTSQEVINIFPEQAMGHYLNGLSNNALKNYEPAIKSLKKAALMTTGDNKLNSQIQGALGDAYYGKKDYESSDAAYEKALTKNPKNTLVLNNYSYYLSLRNEKLDRAAEMAAKANELDPNNPSNMDTYAWVLFKQKKYAEAKQLLEKAIQLDNSQNGTIIEHYGDVLYQLGDTNAAVENWQKAKKTGDTSNNIDKKIKDKKYYE